MIFFYLLKFFKYFLTKKYCEKNILKKKIQRFININFIKKYMIFYTENIFFIFQIIDLILAKI